VRYVGPVSHIRDHHSWHAARGASHIWTAAIVSGFAVVLTGVLAYSAAEAKTVQAQEEERAATHAEMVEVMQKLNAMEQMLVEIKAVTDPIEESAPTDEVQQVEEKKQ